MQSLLKSDPTEFKKDIVKEDKNDKISLNDSKNEIQNSSPLASTLLSNSLEENSKEESVDDLSFIINESAHELSYNQNDSNKSRISFHNESSENNTNEQNQTFLVNSDIEDERLPLGWSIDWTSDGRKYYIGKFSDKFSDQFSDQFKF